MFSSLSRLHTLFVLFFFFLEQRADIKCIWCYRFVYYVCTYLYICMHKYIHKWYVCACQRQMLWLGYSGPPRGLSALCVAASCQGHSKLGSPCSLASLVYTDFSAHSSQNQHPRENGASHQKDTRLQLVKESSQEDALLESLYHQLRLTLYNLLKSVVIFI